MKLKSKNSDLGEERVEMMPDRGLADMSFEERCIYA